MKKIVSAAIVVMSCCSSSNACDSVIDQKNLEWAVKGNKTDLVGKLLSSPLLAFSSNSHGKTVLHIAAERCNHRMMRILLSTKMGRDVIDHTDINGNTALHSAVLALTEYPAAEVENIITVLLEHGANPCRLNNKWLTASDAVDLMPLETTGPVTLLLRKGERRYLRQLSFPEREHFVLDADDSE